MKYLVTKQYGHEQGLSTCFRQWRADSHCRFLHGYPLAFRFTFEADERDERGWVINFGALKPVKQWLQDMFDHKLLIATDDPEKDALVKLGHDGIADTIVVKAVGCEAFAEMAWDHVTHFLEAEGLSPRVHLVEVQVHEHTSNGVILRAST